MISEISVAKAARLGLGKLASVIHPYPTQAEALRTVRRCLQSNAAHPDSEEMDGTMVGVAEKLIQRAMRCAICVFPVKISLCSLAS
jgi:hypothetical protein